MLLPGEPNRTDNLVMAGHDLVPWLLGETPAEAQQQQQQIQQQGQVKQVQQQQQQQNDNPPQQQQGGAMVSPFAAFAGTPASSSSGADKLTPLGSSSSPASARHSSSGGASGGTRISSLTQQLRTSPVAGAPGGTGAPLGGTGAPGGTSSVRNESALSQQVQALVRERCLLPVLQCLLQRREFAMPFDDTVRVALETDVVMAVPPVSDWVILVWVGDSGCCFLWVWMWVCVRQDLHKLCRPNIILKWQQRAV
jgi:hypothetical protein